MSVIISVVPFIISGAVSGILNVAALSIEESSESSQQKSITLASIIRNEELLNKSLVNLGAKNINTAKNGLESNIDEFHVVFEKTATGLFNIKFVGDIEQAEAENFLNELQSEYGRVVQDFVYTKLKQKAEEKGLSLEQETIQQDQSIVLTYNINN